MALGPAAIVPKRVHNSVLAGCIQASSCAWWSSAWMFVSGGRALLLPPLLPPPSASFNKNLPMQVVFSDPGMTKDLLARAYLAGYPGG